MPWHGILNIVSGNWHPSIDPNRGTGTMGYWTARISTRTCACCYSIVWGIPLPPHTHHKANPTSHVESNRTINCETSSNFFVFRRPTSPTIFRGVSSSAFGSGTSEARRYAVPAHVVVETACGNSHDLNCGTNNNWTVPSELCFRQ